MRRRWVLGILIATAACGHQEEAKSTEPEQSTSVTLTLNKAPNLATSTKLAIFRTIEGRPQAVKVGDSVDHAFELFPQPTGAIAVGELPKDFNQSVFESKGWDFAAGKPAEAFGIISNAGRVVVALHQLQGTKEEGKEGQVRFATESFGNPTQPPVTQGPISYWFWEEGDQRYMICAIKKADDLYDVTVALGAQQAMDSLRMSVAAAKEDSEKAGPILEGLLKRA